jgi:predicted DCC family thiol-disulfide oxidoreductase YuxK
LTDRVDDIGGAVLIFDGECGFCTSAANWAGAKFRGGERTQAWQLLDAGALASLHLTRTEVEQAAWWVDRDGHRDRGHRAIGRALEAGGGWRRAVGSLVLAPPTSWLAAALYRPVVRWRHLLPGGACRLDYPLPSSGERPETGDRGVGGSP